MATATYCQTKARFAESMATGSTETMEAWAAVAAYWIYLTDGCEARAAPGRRMANGITERVLTGPCATCSRSAEPAS